MSPCAWKSVTATSCRTRFRGALPDERILTLGIPDDYGFMADDLVALLHRLVPGRLRHRPARERSPRRSLPASGPPRVSHETLAVAGSRCS